MASFLVPQRGLALTTNAQGMVSYTAFDGVTYTFKPWLGRNIVLLTPTNTIYQTNILTKIIIALDKERR